MGCISSKSSAVKDGRGSPTRRSSSIKQFSDPKSRSLNPSRREERDWTKERLDGSGVKVVLIDKKTSASMKSYYDDHTEKKKTEKPEITVLSNPSFGRIPKATEAEQVAAGWPRWLSSVAAEALNGWLPRRVDTFQKLNKIGQGTYSSVYKARDVTHKKLVALKKVRFDNLDDESVKFMAREIIILRRLDHPNIIKLEGLIASPKSSSLYLVFEYMEHDLTGLALRPGIKFTEPQVKCYMQQLLSGLDHCHNRGVLHRDIKGSNLLIDNNGILKIADFGLASFYDPHHCVPLTSRVVTLWYRPPELLLGASHYGVSVDLWSTGCILGELYTGRPILPAKTEVEQLHKIFKLCGSPSDDYWSKLHLRHSTVMKPPHPYRRCLVETFKDLPLPAVWLMDTLLSIDPPGRQTAAFALKSEFFTTQPLACDPSNLPKYPPSKEIDAKLREEEARRNGALGIRTQMVDLEKRMQKETRVNPVADSNAGRRQDHPTFKSQSEVFNPRREENFSGFLVDPTKQTQSIKDPSKDLSENLNTRASLSGPLIRGPDCRRSGREHNDPLINPTKANLSKLPGLVAARTTSSQDQQEKLGASRLDTTNNVCRFPGSVHEGQSKTKHDQKLQKQRVEYSHPVDDTKSYTKDPSLHAHGSTDDKIYVSGPLLVSSNNVDQLLKEHDRRIQEYARRTRHEKARPGNAVNAIFASRHAAG